MNDRKLLNDLRTLRDGNLPGKKRQLVERYIRLLETGLFE